MPVTLRIADVPDDVRRVLEGRAAARGVSLSDYVRQLLVADASRSSRAEVIERMREFSRAMPPPDEPAEVTIRRMRDDRP